MTTATWNSNNDIDSTECEWADIDKDNDLDLIVLGNGGTPNYIFYNNGGTIETSPSWTSSDSGDFNQVSFADVDDDGYFEMAVTDTMEYNYNLVLDR